MNLGPDSRYNLYLKWFNARRASVTQIAGKYYRTAGPRRTTAAEIVQGRGAYNGGGRWNPPAVMNVVYLSGAPETTMYEANEHARRGNLPLEMPKVTVAVHVEANLILDLTRAGMSAELPDAMASLLAEDWEALMNRGNESTTQAMGRAAFDGGLQGLIVPSKPDPNGVNLVVFPENLSKGCILNVLNSEELEKLGKPI